MLLYGAESWTITRQNLEKLDRFHKRSVQYMTGVHIRKCADGTWVHPDHAPLFEKCRILPIEVYIARRQSTLRDYLVQHKRELWEEVQGLTPLAQDPQKVMWWRQHCVSRAEMVELNRQWAS